jgi:hypothetical protein
VEPKGFEPLTSAVQRRLGTFISVRRCSRNRCSYIQARAVEMLSYVAWDLGADGGDAAAIGASRR